nr:mannitol dehydrogenase family protein [Herbiconiux sp. VKM Ac-2851]
MRRDRPAPPVRIVHLGLGAFSRSHIAWYTEHAADGREWGISAYTGGSHELADSLTRQDGLSTLIVRDSDGDRSEVVGSIVRARSGDDVEALLADLAAPATAVVTLTITERGYRSTADGSPDADDPAVADDLALLAAVGDRPLSGLAPRTVLAKLVLGLEERRRRGGGALALLSCDNLPDNGGRLARAVSGLATVLSSSLGEWIAREVTFPSSSVDRITPRLSDAELEQLSASTGDLAPVVAEPFSDWVISGEFPAGRPRWETAGARFVDDLHAWEARKLWMLNGAHTLLACLGLLRGHRTVADAVTDPTCREAVEALWDEDASCLPAGLDLPAYRDALLTRFANARIEHGLVQIAGDSFTKLRLRIVPVAEARLARGESSPATAAVIAAWMVARKRGLLPDDAADDRRTVPAVLAALSAPLAGSPAYAASIESFGNRLSTDCSI